MRWLKQLFTRRRHYNELSETIREHLEEKLADLMNDGMTRDVAERSARRGTTWDDLRKAGHVKSRTDGSDPKANASVCVTA